VFKFENRMVKLLYVSAAPQLLAPAAVASPDAGVARISPECC